MTKINVLPLPESAKSRPWSIEDETDVLQAWEGSRVANSLDEIKAAIALWQSLGRTVEILPCGKGRVGSGFGYYAMIGSRGKDGYLSGPVLVITNFTRDNCVEFAADHGIKLYCP